MTQTPSTWLLLDDRKSHHSQLMGVAERLGWPYTVKNIRYNGFAKLANGPFGARMWHLEAEARATLTPPWPELVIAAGRRSAPVTLSIKKQSPACKLVQLMWPEVAPDRFDLIAVPEHDRLAYQGANLLRTFGAPHAVSKAVLEAEAERFKTQATRLPRPWITVLVGGASKNMHYEAADFKTLASFASAEADRLGGSLLVTTSPRTGVDSEALIKPMLTVPHSFYRFSDKQTNPYVGFLGLADTVIVTGDSVSMCSEACATGKPVYIFVPPHLARDKDSFREALYARGQAKPHIYPIRTDWQPTPMPDAAEDVAQAIRSRLFAA